MSSESPKVDALSIESLALQLHEGGQQDLSLNLPSATFLDSSIKLPEGCKLVDGRIEFESLETRNEVVAKAAFELWSASAFDSDVLFENAYKLWRREIGGRDHASGRLLAIASNSFDILSAAAIRIKAGFNVFDTIRLIEVALPYMPNLEATSIIELVIAKHVPTMNDMMAGSINRALEEWLEKHPLKAIELHKKTLEYFYPESSDLLGNAIVALSKSDYKKALEMALLDANSSVDMQAKIGVWTLGRLLLDSRASPQEQYKIVEVLIKLMEHDSIVLKSTAIRAAVGSIHIFSFFDKLLEDMAESGDQDVLGSVASSLFFRRKELSDRGVVPRWLVLLKKLNSKPEKNIDDFDTALSQLIEYSDFELLVTEAIGLWIDQHEMEASSVFEIFDGTFYKIFSKKSLFSYLVTSWLLNDDKKYPVALMNVLGEYSAHRGESLFLDKEQIDLLSADDLIFLCRRMLGYVHDREQLTSLAISLLKSNDSEKRIYPLLRALFIDEIGYDYPTSTSESLRAASKNILFETGKELLIELAQEVDKIFEEGHDLKVIKELHPPQKINQLFALARSKQMASSFDEASEKSIWRQLATPIPLKAGKGTFSYRYSSYSEPTQLGSFSHSIELPRREVFDPIGNAIRHFGFRLAKRGD